MERPKWKVAAQLASKGFARNLPIHIALDFINKMLLAFKLVKIDHADAVGLRTVGLSDTLFFFGECGGATSGLNMRIRLDPREYPWAAHLVWPDAEGATELAIPHFN